MNTNDFNYDDNEYIDILNRLLLILSNKSLLELIKNDHSKNLINYKLKIEMINYCIEEYEKTEEYEICAELLKIKNKIKR